MRVLGLDQASRTGWAIAEDGMRKPVSGVWNTRQATQNGDETPYFHDFRRRLTDIVREHKPERIFFETPILMRHDTVAGIILRYGLIPVIQLVSADAGLPPPQMVANGDWHERFLGVRSVPPSLKGASSHHKTRWWKEAVVTACAKRNWYITDHNEADACAIADYGLASVSKDYAGQTDALARRAEMEADLARRDAL